ncbi:MAG TPA: RNA 2'-phosphotransferase [Chitinophagales bacterium]|nr:RNA 2'-phosphotransferase [Chitinophagales bacterium]
MDKKLKGASKFISLVLRHKPEEIGLQLDDNGWADVNELITKLNAKGGNLNFETLKEIVATNEKKRFSFNEDYSKIRANQGHSIEVDVELKVVTPPNVLYHGTAERFVESIMATGLQKMSRLHVHLSANYDTAVNVGSRHGKPVVLKVDAKQMSEDGIAFYLSENGVWLVSRVDAKFLTFLS